MVPFAITIKPETGIDRGSFKAPKWQQDRDPAAIWWKLSSDAYFKGRTADVLESSKHRFSNAEYLLGGGASLFDRGSSQLYCSRDGKIFSTIGFANDWRGSLYSQYKVIPKIQLFCEKQLFRLFTGRVRRCGRVFY